jgi:glutamate/tyrosine decarboxylase-like PLP-dependent enzyme
MNGQKHPEVVRARSSKLPPGSGHFFVSTILDQLEDQITNPHNLALALSRNFTSLKAYMLLRAYGKNKYGNLVQQNIDQINYLSELISREPNMEITAPVTSNVVCFRYKPKGLTEPEIEKW